MLKLVIYFSFDQSWEEVGVSGVGNIPFMNFLTSYATSSGLSAAVSCPAALTVTNRKLVS